MSVRILVYAAFIAALAACSRTTSEDAEQPRAANIGLRYMRAGDDAGFAQAIEPRPLVFPADHASHPSFRTEWWYFTGTLEGPTGDAYGFELTFFRVALRPPSNVSRPSAWGTEQIWMAHLAVTDAAGHRFVARERIAREALDLAGVTEGPLRDPSRGLDGDVATGRRW